MTEEKLMSGVYAPVMTPYNVDLSIDHERLFLHCSWLISQGCGLAIFGTNSEANSLSVGERLDVLDILVGRGLNPKKMLPGTGCCSIIDSAVLTTKAIKLGCSGVLMLPPFYYKDVSDDGIFKNFSEIIERVGDSRLKIFLYHFPQMSGLHLSVEVIERLVKAFPDSIVGMKDSTGNLWDNFKAKNFSMFVGSEKKLLNGLKMGAAGCISATTNVTGLVAKKVFDDFHRSGDSSSDTKLKALRTVFDETGNLISALHSLKSLEKEIYKNMLPPLEMLSEEKKKEMLKKLKNLNFLPNKNIAA